MSKKKNNPYLIPLIVLLTVVPLIVRLYVFRSGLAQFDWYQTNDEARDFFLYYKSVGIILAAIAMCLLLAYRYKTKQKEFKFCYEFVPVLIYAFCTFMSSIFSQYRYFCFHGVSEMFESLWVLLGYCVIVFYAYQFINTIEDIDCVMLWLTAGLGVMLVIGILQAAGHDPFVTQFGKMLITGWTDKDKLDKVKLVFEKGRVFLTLYNPNFVASYFSLMIPVEIALLIKNKQWVYRIIYIIMLAASLVCLLASGNRSGIVAFAVTSVLTLVLLYKYILKAWKAVFPAVAIAIAIIAVFVSKNDFILEKFARLISAPDVAEDAISQIITGDEDVAITYLGQVFHVSYELDAEGYVTVSMYDDDQQEISSSYDSENFIYTVADERFGGFAVQVVKLNDEIALDVKADNIDWYFQKGEDGTYYYYNVYGRLDKINNAPRVAVNFLEKKFEERGTIWSKTIPMLKSCILFGTGADTFTAAYPQDDYVDKIYDGSINGIDVKPHCFYLQVAVQSGIPAIIAIVAFYVWYFISSFKLYRKAAYQDGLEIIGVGLLLATFTYMVSSVLNDSTVAVAPIFWIMMGMGLAVNEMLKKKNAPQQAEAGRKKQGQR